MFEQEQDAAPWSRNFPAAASETDIFHCFRLLLGRLPNKEEWPGHSMRAGEPLHQVVRSYVGSLEFARRRLGAPQDGGAHALTALPDFVIYTSDDDAAVGRFVRENQYEADVTGVFRRLLRPGMNVLDLGANIGYFSLLSARLVGAGGSVLAVEPNPRNARLLEASRLANGFGQIRVVQVAAGAEPGLLVLHRSHSNGTTSPAPDSAEHVLDSETVGAVRAETLVPDGRRIDLIKADVEGAEYLALSGCSTLLRRDRPVIICEFSPSLMPGISGIDGPGYLRWLQGFGYRLSVIRPDSTLQPEDVDGIMREYEARGIDHLDLVAEPATSSEATGGARRSFGALARRFGLPRTR